MSGAAEQLTLFDLDICAGRMYQDHSVQRAAKISASSSRRLSELKTAPVQCLDLTPGAGNLLGQSFWEINSAWLGESWMLNSGVSPSVLPAHGARAGWPLDGGGLAQEEQVRVDTSFTGLRPLVRARERR